MKTTDNKKDEAKVSLEKMMETLTPFLPQPDIREIPPQGNWGLPKDFNKCVKERNELDAAAMI